MSETKWEESREGGQIVYTWREFKIRRVQTSGSYLYPTDKAHMTFAWEATRGKEIIFTQINLDNVKNHCEAL